MSYGQDPWQPDERSPYEDPQVGGAYPDEPYGQQRGPGGPGRRRGGYGPGEDESGNAAWMPSEHSPRQQEPPEPRVRSRSGSRAAAGAGTGATGPARAGRRAAGRAEAAPPSGPGHVNQDLDLDDVDPGGKARRRAAKERARLVNTRRTRAMKITALATAGTLVAAAGVGFYLVNHLLSNVQTVSLGGIKNRPPASKANAQGQTALNILVLGSQTRDGQALAKHVGDSSKDGTDLSDTAFIVHIAADRKWAEVVSIPRDLFVPVPACQDRLNPGETHSAQSEAQFYDAMGEGGPACAVATVEQMTDIRMDHFLELTFNAFIQLTDAVGGVQICVPAGGIDDPGYSGLVMSAGLHTVEGNQALAFVRDRHGLAGGTDTSRIQMQQQFMTALFNKLTSNGTLEDPLTLYKIANAISSNITVDPALDNISAMASITESAGTIGKKYIQYVTAPNISDSPGQFSYDEHGAHLSPGPGFQQLWTYLRDDEPLPGSPAAAAFGTSATAAPSTSAPAKAAASSSPSVNPSPTVALKNVTVAVDNGTDIDGEARNAVANLEAMGMTASLGNGGYSGYSTTTILYPSGDQAEADTLADQVVGATVKESSNVSELTLVIGTNAPSAIVASASSDSNANSGSGSGSGSGSASSGGSTSPTPSTSISVEARSGDENICSNLPGDGGQYGGSPSD
jgi:LCP family protein required for cell wall assembly